MTGPGGATDVHADGHGGAGGHREGGVHGGPRGGKRALAGLTLGALGIVYGDIGTSPLYAMRETFEGTGHQIPVTPENVLGAMSLVFWSLIVIISIKYLVFVVRADRDGEGGILALTSLLRPPTRARGGRWTLILLGLFGTALLYGDGMITPAISVLAAVEGTRVAVPELSGFVVPIAVGIIVALFAIQRFGTASIGRAFGPIMLVWFGVLALLGLAQVVAQPSVLQAVNPAYMVRFFAANGFQGFLALGSVFLVVTGGEALYADLGHFGRGPIRTGWFAMVLPALALNYFGQGALLIGNPEAIESPFYRLAPEWAVLPLVGLATMATVIASQALISGVFSLTMQAIQLNYVPRMRVVHTSASAFGQIYIPAVNWGLMVACVALVIGFRSSSALAAAYGVAVTSTMVVTTLLFYVVSRERFGWSLLPAAGIALVFGVIDVAFLGANLFKIPDGGWFPLVVAAAVFTVLTTWKTGKRLVGERLPDGHIPIGTFVEQMRLNGPPPQRVSGSAVYLYGRPGQTPPALIANIQHNNALHEEVTVLSVVTDQLARVPPERRVEVEEVGDGIRKVVVRYGFLEPPDVPGALRAAGVRPEVDGERDDVYVVGAEALVVTDTPGMARWREHLFALLNRNATPAARYFCLPQERTMILAQQVDL